MMRGRDRFAIACRRRSDNEMVTSCEPVLGALKKLAWLKKPFLRGTFALADAMALGIKSLTFSAEVATADEEAAKQTQGADPSPAKNNEDTGQADARKQQLVNSMAISGSVVLALVLAVVLFVFLPMRTAWLLKHWTDNRLVLGLAEGVLKLALLLGYVSAISMWSEIRRVFEYHGAEHKTINAYEAGDPLDVEHVQKHTTVHVRCGTSFLLVVIVTSIIVFMFIRWDVVWQRFVYKMLLLPIVAGIAYEIIQFAGGHKSSRFMRAALAPGLLMQKITTKEPSDDQVEVAIKSLQLVLESEGEQVLPST